MRPSKRAYPSLRSSHGNNPARGMPPRALHHIKREVRVLGVASSLSGAFYEIIGIVFRGRFWLDGMIRGRSDSQDLTTAIANTLGSSPQAGQVRVILLDRSLLPEEASVDPMALWASTTKPVIALRWPGSRLVWRSNGQTVPYNAFGVGKWASQSVLSTSTVKGGEPEPLRVASLVLGALSD